MWCATFVLHHLLGFQSYQSTTVYQNGVRATSMIVNFEEPKVCGLHQVHSNGQCDDGPPSGAPRATDEIKPPASKTGPGPHRQGQWNGSSIEEVEALQGLQDSRTPGGWKLEIQSHTKRLISVLGWPIPVSLGPNGIAPETQSLSKEMGEGSTRISILRWFSGLGRSHFEAHGIKHLLRF